MSPPAAGAAGSAVCLVRAAHGTGAGFAFLEPHWVVTAQHVTRHQTIGDAVELLFGGRLRWSARIVALHPHVDLAVLRVTGGSHGVVPLRPATQPSTLAEPTSCFAIEAGPATDQVAARLLVVPSFERTRRHRDGREEDLVIFPSPAYGPPRSGGPLLSHDGTVIGVIVDSIELAGHSYIRATAIDALLPNPETSAMDPAR